MIEVSTEEIWTYFDQNEQLENFRTCKKCMTRHIYNGKDVYYLVKHISNTHRRKRPRTDEVEVVEQACAKAPDCDMESVLCKFVALQRLPIENLNGGAPCREEYVKLMPNLPTSGFSIRNLIIDKFKEHRNKLTNKLKDLIDSNHRFSITTQEYTSNSHKKYISVKIFGVTKNGEPFNHSLGLKRIKRSLSSEVYSQAICEILHEYGIETKQHIVGLTTDGSKKMLKVGKLLEPLLHQICTANSINSCMVNSIFKLTSVDNQSEEIDVSDDKDAPNLSHGNENSNDLTEAMREEIYTEEQYATKEEVNDIINKLKEVSETLRNHANDLDEVNMFIVAGRRFERRQDWHNLYLFINEFILLRKRIEAILREKCKFIDVNDIDLQKMVGIIRILSILNDGIAQMSIISSSCLASSVLTKSLHDLFFFENEILGNELSTAIHQRLSENESRSPTIKILQWLKNPKNTPIDQNLQASVVFHIVRLFPCLLNNGCLYHNDKKNTPAPVQAADHSGCIEKDSHAIPKPSDINKTNKSLFEEIKEAKLTNCRGPILNLLLNALLTIRPIAVEEGGLFMISDHSTIKLKCSMSDELVNALNFLHYNKSLYL